MMHSDLTWELAKAETQAMELEIAGVVPAAVVVALNQNAHGTLLSCSETEWSWNGAMTVTVVEGTDVDQIVREIQAHYEGSRFDLVTDLDILGHFQLQMVSAETAENYIIAEGSEPNQVRIASGSACFTLPEGTWPRGEF
jgi:hypothetical protein